MAHARGEAAAVGVVVTAAEADMAVLLLLATGVTAAVPAATSAPFELVLGLRLRRLEHLERQFWRIADPSDPLYLRHLSREEVADLIAPPVQDVDAAAGWLREMGAHSVAVSPLSDTVTGAFASDDSVARSHRHLWSAPRGSSAQRLPARSNHTRPLDFIMRRDHATSRAAETGRASRLGRASSGGTAYDIAKQKAAYKMPADLTVTNAATLQMVWGPGTFGYGEAELEDFRDAQCPLLNVNKVSVDGYTGTPGGDNYGEGNLDVTMITSFGLNATTLVSNTNTSASTEEGADFGAAFLDFITSLAARATLPQVLSLSLGSLSPYSCELLCTEAVKRSSIGLAECQAYMQTQRQVCMYIDKPQTARINVALQVLGRLGVAHLQCSW